MKHSLPRSMSYALAIFLFLMGVFGCTAKPANAQYYAQAIHNFTGADGAYPVSSLVLGTDGNYYGMTDSTVFSISPSGAFTAILNQGRSESPNGDGGLVEGKDGCFYGPIGPGQNGGGTVSKLTPPIAPSTTWIVTILHSFSKPSFYNEDDPSAPMENSDGDLPGTLTLGSDGNFYGTTYEGGTFGGGTVFRVSPAGTFATLVNLPAYFGLRHVSFRGEMVTSTARA